MGGELFFHEVDKPGADDGSVLPAGEDVFDRDVVGVGVEEVHPFSDGLKHAEFDAVMDEFDEVSGAGGAAVDEASGGAEGLEDGLEVVDRAGFAAGHETGAVSGTVESARGAEINESELAFVLLGAGF